VLPSARDTTSSCAGTCDDSYGLENVKLALVFAAAARREVYRDKDAVRYGIKLTDGTITTASLALDYSSGKSVGSAGEPLGLLEQGAVLERNT
jgi:hypothetical protein